MTPFPEAIVDAASLRHYELEWIVRGRPVHLLPLCCIFREDKAYVRWLTEGMLPCAEVVRMAVDAEEDPSAWLVRLLSEIQALVAQSEDALLDPNRFVLRSDALWFFPSNEDRGAGGASYGDASLSPTPCLAYLPATEERYDGSLAELAEELAEMAIADRTDETPDSGLLVLRDAAVAGQDALKTLLSDTSSPASYRKNDITGEDFALDEAEANPGEDFSGRPGHSPLLRSLRIAGWLVGPALVACLPAIMRLFWLDRLDHSAWRMLSAGCLGLTAVADALLLFMPASPLRLSGLEAGTTHSSRPHDGPLREVSRFFRDVRVSGLLSACASRMGALGRMGAHTAPVETLDPSERLGFLSEGEPGTPEETKGLRAYILTADFVIGRDPDLADLVLPDTEVGRAHARITQYNGSFFLTDLGSVNGTRLDGRRLDKHVQEPLPDRCRIGIAGRKFYFTVD